MVVARDHIEIVVADAPVNAVRIVSGNQQGGRILRQRTVETHTLRAQRPDRLRQRQRAAVQLRRFFGGHAGLAQHGLAGIPAVLFEIIADAGAHIRPIGPQVDAPVRVRIHGIAAIVRRHELRRTHGAGIRSLHFAGVEAHIARQQEKLLEFIAKEFRASGVIECQCGERVEHPVRAGQAAVVGFDAENCREIFRGNSAAHAGLIERLTMREPEIRALAYAPFGEKDRAVLEPGFGLFGGAVHGLDDGRLALGLFHELAQLPLLERRRFGHMRDEALDVGALDVERGRGFAVRPQQKRGRQQVLRGG